MATTTTKYAHRLYAKPLTKGNMGGWQERHMDACTGRGTTPAQEFCIVKMISGWLLYADIHAERYESGIGDDGVLGPQWAQIGLALLALLNGELGRLDGGTLDGLIRGVMQDEGFDPDTM